jgi:predicted enzyme related to lactoylglutathione lyase
MDPKVAREGAKRIAAVARLAAAKLVAQRISKQHLLMIREGGAPVSRRGSRQRLAVSSMISRMANSVAKWQILSTDPDQTAKFYSSLFGWPIDSKNALGYRELKTSNGIDGGVWPAPPEAHDFVQLFIEVDDIDAAIAKATSLGGNVLVPKSALPDGDTMAILRDPRGLSFGLMAKR